MNKKTQVIYFKKLKFNRFKKAKITGHMCIRLLCNPEVLGLDSKVVLNLVRLKLLIQLSAETWRKCYGTIILMDIVMNPTGSE